MKHIFVVNPAAGRSDKTDYVRKYSEIAIGNSGGDFEVYVTEGPGDATGKVIREAESGRDIRVYACGGDGTLNECVNGAALRDNVSVAPFPTGTGNDFVRCFGEDSAHFKNLQSLVSGRTEKIDLIKCNNRYSINICSVGMDARIGRDVHKYSSLPLIGGRGGYILSTAVNFFKGINTVMEISGGGFFFRGDTALICACNGRYYGGAFNPVPTAQIHDGIMDILVIKGMSRLTFLRCIGKYSKGRFRELPQYITHLQTDSLTVRSEDRIPINIDGEISVSNEISFEIVPQGLSFIVPSEVPDLAACRA